MSQLHPEHSPDESVRASRGGAVAINRIEISERTWTVIALVISVSALVFGIVSQSFYAIRYHELEREYRLLANKYDDLRVALLAQDIKVSKHHLAESP